MINYKNKFSVLVPSEEIVEEIKEEIIQEVEDLSIIKEESLEMTTGKTEKK